MSTRPDERAAPAWTAHRVPVFQGLFDTKIDTGEDYDVKPLVAFFTMKPWSKPKASGPGFVPSLHHDFDAREHAAQREKGAFVCLTGDIDKGDHPKLAVTDAVQAFAGDAAWLVYSSPHARPGDLRWRILLPLDAPVPFDTWFDAQTAFFAFMEARGFAMDHALARAAQPVFLPNVPASHAKSGTALRGDDGAPLFYTSATSGADKPGLSLDAGPVAEGIAALRRKRLEDDAARDRIRKEAEARRASAPRGDGASLMEDFNAGTSVATMLEACGYEQSPRSAEDWRSPHQTGETYATRIIGSKWVSLSESDTSAGLGERCKSGCFGDAYDLFVHYKHGGDHKAAYRALGQERRDANVVYLPQPEPPEWMDHAPPPDEPPEWLDAEPVEFEPEPVEAPEIRVVDAFDFNEADIPTRPWIVPGALLSGYTHILAAPGGSGKSLFTLQLALALARGEPWGGFKPRRAARSLLINVEDDLDEQRRRLSAARHVMGIDSIPAGMVRLVDGAETIVVATPGERTNTIVTTPIVDALRRYIIDNEIDVLFVDPFAETFEGDENDNSQVKWAMRIWRDEIARATGCAVYLVHHTTKYAQNGAGDANVIRGAGAIVNSTRISATLMPMTPEDAQMIGVEPDERHLYVRYDDAKANQSLKSGVPRWFRKETVEIGNGGRGFYADEVGALVPWSPPDCFDGLSGVAISSVLDKIEAGLGTGARYTASTKGGSKESGRWVGTLIMAEVGLKEAAARKVITTWLNTGVLVEGTYHCPERRRDRSGLFAPHDKRPGAPQ